MKGHYCVYGIGCLVVSVLAVELARAQVVCPPMPDATTKEARDVKNKVELSVGSLGKVKMAELSAQTEVTAKSLFKDFPNADKMFVIQMMLSTYCSTLKDDSIPAREKGDRWQRFQSTALSVYSK